MAIHRLATRSEPLPSVYTHLHSDIIKLDCIFCFSIYSKLEPLSSLPTYEPDDLFLVSGTASA
jgi:hypothetical protein